MAPDTPNPDPTASTVSTLEPMPGRYEGFPGLMQGGYLAGVAAGPTQGPTRVQIRRPVRAGEVLTRHEHDGRCELLLDGEDGPVIVMAAFPDGLRSAPPPPLDPSELDRAMGEPLPWAKPFRDCVGCGDGPDSLGVEFRVAEARQGGGILDPARVVSTIVGTWTPEGTGEVDHRDIWTVIDCLTSWAVFVDPPDDPQGNFVTGNIAVELRRPMVGGRPYRLRSWRQTDLPPGESLFRLGSVIVGGLIEDDDGIVVLADQEMARSSQFGMTLAPGGGPGPLPHT